MHASVTVACWKWKITKMVRKNFYGIKQAYKSWPANAIIIDDIFLYGGNVHVATSTKSCSVFV